TERADGLADHRPSGVTAGQREKRCRRKGVDGDATRRHRAGTLSSTFDGWSPALLARPGGGTEARLPGVRNRPAGRLQKSAGALYAGGRLGPRPHRVSTGRALSSRRLLVQWGARFGDGPAVADLWACRRDARDDRLRAGRPRFVVSPSSYSRLFP